MVCSAAVVTDCTIGRAGVPPDFGWGALAMTTLAAVGAPFIIVDDLVIFQLVLFYTTVLAAGCISPLGLQ